MPLARHDCILALTDCRQYEFLLTCLLRGMTLRIAYIPKRTYVSTHMPLARHDSAHILN